jgi:hypothetical protein
MRKFGLSEWASIAEIAGMLGVIASLVFVAISLERNTLAVSGQTADQIYDASRTLDLVLLQDPELLALSNRGHAEWETLTQREREWYLQFVGMNIDLWEQMLARQSAGLITSETMRGWSAYFSEFVRRQVSQEMWEEINWWWSADESDLHALVEASLSSPIPNP